jgi:hypothetical protein
MQPDTISRFLTLVNLWSPFEFVGQVRLPKVWLCYVKLCYARLTHFMFRGLVMDGHASLSLTSLSLISHRSCSLHLDSIFTAEHYLSRMATPSHAL